MRARAGAFMLRRVMRGLKFILPVMLLGCGASVPRELNVSAAMSLKEAFTELEAAFEAKHPGLDVVFNFAGSQILAAQIVEGAQVDVFASADDIQMERAASSGRVGAVSAFATSRLVLITPAGDRGKISSVSDLTRPGVRLVLAGPTVPAGAYAREALAQLGVGEQALANVVSNEENVRGVVGKVAAGEADAGIVYVTDVTPALAPKLKRIELGVAIWPRYQVAALKDSIRPREAQRFVEMVLGAEGQATLARHGFLPP